MSELNIREQLPLLGEDDYSGEESLPHSEGRRFWKTSRRYAAVRGRATSKMKGASAIILQWPDHVSSSVFNCWMAFFLLMLVFVVMYGIILACSVIPTNRYRYGRGLHNAPSNITSLETVPILPQVFCPIIVNVNDKFDLTSYVKPFKKLKIKFPKFDYNIIILVNDTDKNSAIDNNVRAMNHILNHEIITNEIEKSNGDLSFNVQKHLLSDFIEKSPLKNNWKSIAPSLMPFMARAVSIWESGGIAFDPNLIKYDTSDLIRLKYYVEEALRNFSEDTPYKHESYLISTKEKVLNDKMNQIKPYSKNINNIRDVIENLEKNNIRSKSQDLKGEESKISSGPVMRKLLSTSSSVAENKTFVNNISTINDDELVVHTNKDSKKSINSNLLIKKEANETGKDTKVHEIVDNTFILNKTNNLNETRVPLLRNIHSNIDLVPYFFNIFFNKGSNDKSNKELNSLKSIFNLTDYNLKSEDKNKYQISKRSTTRVVKNVKSTAEPNTDIITFGKGDTKSTEHTTVFNKGNIAQFIHSFENLPDILKYEDSTTKISAQPISNDTNAAPKVDDDIKLVVDIEGKLIATKASCHAYIGHIFNIVQKHGDLTSTAELIDKAFMTFCHDKPDSSCDGIKLLV